MTSREMVAEFMRHIGHDTPELRLDCKPAIAGLRASLILEEYLETHRAMLARDIVGTCDGFADLKYTVIGAAVAHGLPIRDFFYTPFPLEPAASPESAGSFVRATASWLSTAMQALAGYGDLASALHGLDVALSMEAAAAGLPLRELFAEVHKSNMSKESGASIGVAKYGPGGGKGREYNPPDIVGVLEAASRKT